MLNVQIHNIAINVNHHFTYQWITLHALMLVHKVKNYIIIFYFNFYVNKKKKKNKDNSIFSDSSDSNNL